MIGWVAQEDRRGWRPRLEEKEVLGLHLLQVSVPVRPGLGRERIERRTKKAARLLRSEGCRRVLTAEDYSLWPLLVENGLIPVDAGALCMSLGCRLALADLECCGIPEQEATVALVGRRVDRFFFDAATALAARVRHLAICAGESGGELAAYLERERGMPVLERVGGAHVKLYFTLPSEVPGRDELVLCGPSPSLGPLEMSIPQPLPGGLDMLPLLALLWEEGRIKDEEIEIMSVMPR